MLFLLVYVDILITGDNSEDVHQVIKDLNAQFALMTLGSVNYFLGFEVTRTPSSLHLSQSKYVADLLLKTNMENSKPSPTPHVFEYQIISRRQRSLFSSISI